MDAAVLYERTDDFFIYIPVNDYLSMCMCVRSHIYTTVERVRINRVRLPILHVVS